MNHTNEEYIKCPYCDWEDEDSCEFDCHDAVVTCDNCRKKFHVYREITITYDSSKINCETNNIEHKYELDEVWMSKPTYFTNESALSSEYYKIMVCSICEQKEYIPITKEEYEQLIEEE